MSRTIVRWLCWVFTSPDLTDTVGIHPTVAEEFTGMSVLKSSGNSATKAGC
eukprot:gene37011-49940_t